MTKRAVALGILLGVFIAVFSYFNTQVIRQTYLIGNHFPIIIFGTILALVLIVNPLIGLIRIRWMLSAREVLTIGAIGLMACGWPGSAFFRVFSNMMVIPPHTYKTMPDLRAARVMSYVPGASPRIAEGHIRDFAGLAGDLAASAELDEDIPRRRIWDLLSYQGKQICLGSGKANAFAGMQRKRFVDALNGVIADHELYDSTVFKNTRLPAESQGLIRRAAGGRLSDYDSERLNRMLMVATFPEYVMPAPRGDGFVLDNGRADSPAGAAIMQGDPDRKLPPLRRVHWRTWWPVISMWGSMAIFLGIGCFCLMMILQVQWRREMLQFPIATFAREATERSAGGLLPDVARTRLFWYGVAAMAVVHLLGGLAKWFPGWFITIPLTFDFSGLNELNPLFFGNIKEFALKPHIYPAVVAFVFFLSTDISLSVGISPFVYAAFMAITASQGFQVRGSWAEPGQLAMLRAGTYFGFFVMMLYLGRRYYLRVAAKSLGLVRGRDDVPRDAPPAAWVCVGSLAIAVVTMIQAGLEWPFAILLTAIIIVLFTILARIVAETGLFFLQPFWMPFVVIQVLFGAQALGPTTYFILSLISFVLALDVRDSIMPHLANGLRMATEEERQLPRRPLLGVMCLMIALSFVLAFCATLLTQYAQGLNLAGKWASETVPMLAYRSTAKLATELSAMNELSPSLDLQGLERVSVLRPDAEMLGWLAAGAVLVAACGWMRMRFAWWFLHPVFFLVFSSHSPPQTLGASILVGWGFKAAVVKLSGARGFHRVKPLAIGVIAGELIMGLLWVVVGVVFYFVTGRVPVGYSVFRS